MNFEDYLSYISQPVLIIDRLNQTLFMNRSFASLFPRVELAETLYVWTDIYPALLPLITSGEGTCAVEHCGRHYQVSISFARRGKQNQPVARCMLFSDVTKTHLLLEKILQQSELLYESNENLKAQNDELEKSIQMEHEAASRRTQAQLLRDIHDTLGHTLVMVGALYNLAQRTLSDAEKARMHLREAHRWIGISLADMESAGDYGGGSFVLFLNRFRDAMARVGMEITLHIFGEELPEHSYICADLIRICQEAATNAIRHGKATQLEVIYRISTEDFSLYLKDNGHSEQVLRNGHGLKSMDERVNNLFGEISYGWHESGGFYVEVAAPIIREDM
jgi:Signal transduction histidine kinase